MAKISVAKFNRSERQERGPMSRKTTSRRTPAHRNSRRRMSTPYNNIDYKANVLARDNIRILDMDTIIKLDREDRAGQNMLDVYNAVRDMITQRNEETTETGTFAAMCHRFLRGHNKHKDSRSPYWDRALDESLTSQEKALEIDEYLFRSKARVTLKQRQAEKKRKSEEKFQDLLIADVKLLQNLMQGEDSLEGLTNHKIHNGIGPKNVTAHIRDHIKPDYLCGYSDPESAFSISREVWDKIPRSLRVLSPQANTITDCLFLPFLALELKWRGTPKRVVQNQLARCLSILAERQAELEKEMSNSVSTTPIFGLTGVERNFTLWVIFRYESYENEVHYDMCELASYDLTSGADVDDFRAAMTNIHNWVENERKAYFMKCINSAK
ncbi:hypothetical protein TWF718_004923 [Orbilia javanica]|uniref:Uncharacterized protein n=1 Tax=Orbilia javanica TaxID=47235 RepID=A0AAN8RQY7_9PEZI